MNVVTGIISIQIVRVIILENTLIIFSAWMIYGSLLSLSYDPYLWELVKGAGDESLLFKYDDYKNRSNAEGFSALEKHQEPTLRKLGEFLKTLATRDVANVPPLELSFRQLNKVAKGAGMPSWLAANQRAIASEGELPCPLCRKNLRLKQIRLTGAEYLECSGSPACRYTKILDDDSLLSRRSITAAPVGPVGGFDPSSSSKPTLASPSTLPLSPLTNAPGSSAPPSSAPPISPAKKTQARRSPRKKIAGTSLTRNTSTSLCPFCHSPLEEITVKDTFLICSNAPHCNFSQSI
jgi:ssDNA-binding Zn-finger/Zn-ribbon topoisomerase 1